MSRSRRNKRCQGPCCSPTKARRECGEERPRDKREDERAECQMGERVPDNECDAGTCEACAAVTI